MFSALPKKTSFNVDKVCKMLGSNLYNSTVVNGMVFKRTNEGDITKQTDAKIAVYTCPIDCQSMIEITTTETKDGKLLPRDVELAYKVDSYANTLPRFERYVAEKFAVALEDFVKILTVNTGVKSYETLAELGPQHSKGNKNAGSNIEPKGSSLIDVPKVGTVDPYSSKFWGLHYATQAACTILKVDEIIMAERAGGPKAPMWTCT